MEHLGGNERAIHIKDITEVGYFEDNPKWIDAKKREEEALTNKNRVYNELSKPAEELVKEFTTTVGEKVAKLVNSDRISGLGESLVEVFLKRVPEPGERFGHERKVSAHIVAPIPSSNEVTEASLKIRNFAAGDDIDLLIPEDASPQNVVRAVEILKPYLDATSEVDERKRKLLIDKVGWKLRKHLT